MKNRAATVNAAATLAFLLAFAGVLSAPAFAQSQCLTLSTPTSSTSRATTGTSVTISVPTSGSSCTVSALVLVSSPSLTVNDPADGQYSGFSAGTTKSFTVTAGTTGTYTYYAQGTTSAGSVETVQQTIEFISPSDLTVSAEPASASVTQGNTFSLTVEINNPTSSAVTTSYAINLPSGLTRNSGDPLTSSGTTISAGAAKTLALTIAHTTCMTSGTVTVDVGDTTGAASVSVTGNSSCSSGSSGSSSGSGSGGAAGGGAGVTTKKAYAAGKATVDIPVILGGATESVDLDATETTVRKIEITVKGIARSINIIIEKSKLPLGTPAPPGTVSHYISITKANVSDENIGGAKLEFRLEKSWITGNKIDENTVALYRYTSSWEKMTTTKLSSDDSYVYYSASLPGLSLFAVSGEKTPEAKAEEAQQQQQQPSGGQQNQTGGQQNQTGGQPGQGADFIMVAVIVVAVLAIGGLVFYMVFMKGKKGYSYKGK